MSVTLIRSEWVSGNLVFYEDTVGQSVTGDVFTIGTAAVKVGGTSQDVDFQWYAASSKSFILDAGAGTLTMVGLDVSIDGDLTLDLEDLQIGDNQYLMFGDAALGDVSARWDTAKLEILPAVDDTGSISIGNGTKDIDVRVYLGVNTAYVDFNVGDAALVISAGVQLDVDDVTAASSATTGSIHTAGGVGIAGALWVGTTSRLVGAVTCDGVLSIDDTTASSSTVTGSIHTDGGLGVAGATYLGSTLTVGVSDAGYDVTFYGDTVGCNFLWDQNLDTGGGLQLGADTKATHFYAYGATTGNYLKWDAAADDLLLVGTATQLAVAGTTTSSSTTTGSLRTAGGLGVAGTAFFGGLVTSNSVTGFRSLPVFVPDATRTNYAFACGNRVTELDVTMATAADQNLDPLQINLNIIGTAPTTGTLNGVYQQITHDTTDMPNIRLKGCDWTITTDKECQDAYVMQTELIVSGTKTSSGELMAMSALTTLGTGARTADRVLAFQAMISGDGTAGTVVGDCFVAYIVNAGTVITTDAVLKVFNQSASTATNLASIETDGTCTSMLQFTNDGTTTYLLDIDDNSTSFVSAAGAGAVGANPVKIKVQIDGGVKYLIAADGWS